jgi:hypothetical protein
MFVKAKGGLKMNRQKGWSFGRMELSQNLKDTDGILIVY